MHLVGSIIRDYYRDARSHERKKVKERRIINDCFPILSSILTQALAQGIKQQDCTCRLTTDCKLKECMESNLLFPSAL